VLYGVALDVCDKYAVEGIRRNRPQIDLWLVTDAVRAIHADAATALLEDWERGGVKMVTSADILAGKAEEG
jgi:hypothetical protein